MTSGKQKLVIGLSVVGIILLIGPSIIFPGIELIPDASYSNHIVFGASHAYVSKLGAGTWTVTVTQGSWDRLDFDLHVTTGLFLLPVSIASETTDGRIHSKSVTFTLNESTVVHVRVSESSVYHDTTGSYTVVVTGDGESFDTIFPIAVEFFTLMFILPVVLMIFCIIFGSLSAKKQQGRLSSIRRTMPQPGYVVPGSSTQHEEGSDLRAPRLPSKCPTCSADLSDSNIDWTGPMEATCLHCGAIVKAKFERI